MALQENFKVSLIEKELVTVKLTTIDIMSPTSVTMGGDISGNSGEAVVDTVGGKTKTDIADAVDKKHAQNSDTKLDEGQPNEVASSDIKDAISKEHEHGNKTELDKLTDGDHDVRVDNPHVTSKSHVGLGSVTNDSQLKRAGGDINTFTEKASPVDTDVVLIEDSADSYNKKKVQVANLPGVGGGAEWRFMDIPAGAWDYPVSNPSPLDTDVGTNNTIKRHLFDDTTEEFVIAQIKLPSDLDASGTVYFEACGYAVTADGNEIQLRFSHKAIDKGESWDSAYNAKDSGDYVTDANQDELDEVEWNETISNLGWSAGDIIRIKLSRIAIADGTKLTGDWGLIHFRIKLPRV